MRYGLLIAVGTIQLALILACGSDCPLPFDNRYEMCDELERLTSTDCDSEDNDCLLVVCIVNMDMRCDNATDARVLASEAAIQELADICDCRAGDWDRWGPDECVEEDGQEHDAVVWCEYVDEK